MKKVAQKLHGGWGGWSSGPCKHCFQYLIPVYQLLRYPGYDWSILGQFTSTLSSSSGFTHAESRLNRMLNMWNPPSPHLLTFWHFWHKKLFFRKWGEAVVGGLRYIKNANRLSPCVSLPLFPYILFHCSLAFFTCLHWLRTTGIGWAQDEIQSYDSTMISHGNKCCNDTFCSNLLPWGHMQTH